MDSFHDEDNNPFAGSDHLFAHGITGNIHGTTDLTSSAVVFGGGDSDNYNHHDGYSNSYNDAATETSILGGSIASTSMLDSSTADDSIIAHRERIEQINNGYSDEENYADGNSAFAHNQPSSINLESNFIEIVEASQIRDPKGSSAVAYTIRYNLVEVKRRYSEFDSLRKALTRLFPTIIIPPIPEKHSVLKYFWHPLNAKNDMKIIEKRKRMLTAFLSDCFKIPELKECVVFTKFLDPAVTWGEVINSPPISVLPASNLLAPPLNPTKPSPLHLLLPIPQSASVNNFRPREEDKQAVIKFKEYEQIFRVYKLYVQPLEKCIKRQKRHFKGLVRDLGELGAYFNAFSLEDGHTELSSSIEKTGQAIDGDFINSEAFAFKILTVLEEPITEIVQYSNEALNVLQFRKLKEIQLFIITTTIKRRHSRIDALRNAQEQANRLEEVLKRNAEQSPTIAAAVKRLEQGQTVTKTSTWNRMFGGKTNKNDVTLMNEVQRQEEIAKTEKEILKLSECLKIILRDIDEVNRSIEENIQSVLMLYNTRWKAIMHAYTQSLMIWLTENLRAWEDAKEEISRIEIVKPTECYQEDDRIPAHLK